MRKFNLDHFKPYPIRGGGRKCQPVKSNDYKGIDPNLNVRPAILELYEAISDTPQINGGLRTFSLATNAIGERYRSNVLERLRHERL